MSTPADPQSGLDFNGQVAVITGAGRGIGRSIARRLAREGMSIVCAARTLDEVEDTAAAIVNDGGQAVALSSDVTREEDMEGLMNFAAERFGHLDLAFLNAGMTGGQPIESYDVDEWQRSITTNLTGVFLGIRAAIPHLRSNGGGKIVAVGSGASTQAPAGNAAYAASKAGVTALVRSASRELRQLNIAVNEMQPGATATVMHGVTERDVDESNLGSVEHTSTGPTGEWFKAPSAVAELALFIVRLPNHGTTGQIFSLNTFR